ncbi:alpha/beta family hydrolase [Nesterenkonia natronophila]|uniref:Uncharacterized protein n=1 Tax=Nesterenkonia natronophila TaxID=2174932 RepID=A0A3A4F8F5_9MICC|nr:alpha/beta family hydrolase [Nesterenkonia natronophila]RJN32760.1 hypothetical protein D3250_02760 [Nesterenkonia natronophila]
MHLPGLEADGPNFGHGRSPLSLIDGLTNDSAHMTGAVADALAEVGAPKGAEVFMTGFSLGGLHATNMAKSRDFQQEYNLRAVTTVGSPTRSGPTRPGVKVTHLEDARDPVPHLTGDRHELSAERMVIEYNHQNPDSAVESIAGSAHTWEHNLDGITLMEDNEADWLDLGERNHLDEFRAQLRFDAEVETYVFESHWQPMDTPEHIMPWQAGGVSDLDYLGDALQDGARELRRLPPE